MMRKASKRQYFSGGTTHVAVADPANMRVSDGVSSRPASGQFAVAQLSPEQLSERLADIIRKGVVADVSLDDASVQAAGSMDKVTAKLQESEDFREFMIGLISY